MTARLDNFVLEQARARLVDAFGMRATAARQAGMPTEYVLARAYEEIETAAQYAAEVVRGLDAVPFIEQYLLAEMTNSACNAPPVAVEASMKMREGFAGVLRQLNDKRALAHFGADAICADMTAQYFPNSDKPK